jgi:thioredoxin reductase
LRVLQGTAAPIEHEQPRPSTLRGWLLGYQLIGQLEVEIGDVHLINIPGSALAAECGVYDVVIVGGGPAGLSAALVLGRCRRSVLVCDAGRPRNARSQALHGYLTRDGTPPLDFLRTARDELRRYGIEPRQATVTAITCTADGFSVTLDDGAVLTSRTVLVATGVRDTLPEVPGVDECYGISVHHCPYCDGWEVRDRALVVIGKGAAAAGLALSLKTWSDRVTICTDGRARIHPRHRLQLEERSIRVHEAGIERLDHEAGHARALVLADGVTVLCDAVFFTMGQSPQCDLPRQLGCELTRKGVVKTDHLGQTRVPGLYVAGDASRDVQFVIVAAAEGAKAGVAINKALQAKAGLTVDASIA